MLTSAQAQAAPTASIAPFGTGEDGKVVQLVTLTNDRGMTVRFSTRGGVVTEVLTPDRKGQKVNVVLGRPDFATWEKAGGFNSIIGRFANRIAGGGFTIDGQFYKLAGANPTTNVVIHGGPGSFSQKVWAPAPFQRGSEAGAVMTYVSADGENGFPGELTVRMTYTLTNANVFRIDYDAITTKPTIVNLTNHSYFNLSGHESGPINDSLVQIFASNYTPSDRNTVPTGEIAPVAGTPLDFRQPVRAGDAIYSNWPGIVATRGLDHNFVLDKPAPRTLALAVRMRDPKSGRQLDIRTTEPGVQVYSANGLNGTIPGSNGRMLRMGDGLAFETQHYPDSPNKPHFPTTVLRPGQTFRSTTEWAFSTFR